MKLEAVLTALNSSELKQVVKDEIQKIESSQLPLQKGLAFSSYVSERPISCVILNLHEEDHLLFVKAGIFYTGIIAGCSCSDDPSPTDEQNEYCELLFKIELSSAEATVELLND